MVRGPGIGEAVGKHSKGMSHQDEVVPHVLRATDWKEGSVKEELNFSSTTTGSSMPFIYWRAMLEIV